MTDLLYVVLFVVLTGIAWAFVVGCDKIIGPDDVELVEEAARAGREQRAEQQVEEHVA